MGDDDGAARHRSILRAKEPCRVMTQHDKKLQFEEVSIQNLVGQLLHI